jgi:hypothetical protein
MAIDADGTRFGNWRQGMLVVTFDSRLLPPLMVARSAGVS